MLESHEAYLYLARACCGDIAMLCLCGLPVEALVIRLRSPLAVLCDIFGRTALLACVHSCTILPAIVKGASSAKDLRSSSSSSAPDAYQRD